MKHTLGLSDEDQHFAQTLNNIILNKKELLFLHMFLQFTAVGNAIGSLTKCLTTSGSLRAIYTEVALHKSTYLLPNDFNLTNKATVSGKIKDALLSPP